MSQVLPRIVVSTLAFGCAGLALAQSKPFSIRLMPKNHQALRNLSEDQRIVEKNDRAKVEVHDGFLSYSSAFLPHMHYLPDQQAFSIPTYVVTQAPTIRQDAEGTRYVFEGHETFETLDKFGRVEVLVEKQGTCTLSWDLKVILRTKVYSQATGRVAYACGQKTQNLSKN